MHPRSFAADAALLLMLVAVVWLMLVLVGVVHAEPMPQPKVGQCPSGYAVRPPIACPCEGTRRSRSRRRGNARPGSCRAGLIASTPRGGADWRPPERVKLHLAPILRIRFVSWACDLMRGLHD